VDVDVTARIVRGRWDEAAAVAFEGFLGAAGVPVCIRCSSQAAPSNPFQDRAQRAMSTAGRCERSMTKTREPQRPPQMRVQYVIAKKQPAAAGR